MDCPELFQDQNSACSREPNQKIAEAKQKNSTKQNANQQAVTFIACLGCHLKMAKTSLSFFRPNPLRSALHAKKRILQSLLSCSLVPPSALHQNFHIFFVTLPHPLPRSLRQHKQANGTAFDSKKNLKVSLKTHFFLSIFSAMTQLCSATFP